MVRETGRLSASGRGRAGRGPRPAASSAKPCGVPVQGDDLTLTISYEGGMPRLVDGELWDHAQRKLGLNKHARAGEDPEAPRYWLTGKVFCGHCGETMRGTHGTSKTGKRHYYYACKGKQQHSGCSKRHERKEYLEEYVLDALRYLLWDAETRASIAADAAAWYAEHAEDDTMLRSLEGQLRETSTALDNVMSAIEQGVITKSTKERLLELEDSKEQLEKQIAIERAKAALAADEHTIAAYFERYADADLDDPRVRDGVLDYFIDKRYVYDDGTLDLVGWFTSAHDTLHVSLSDLDGDMMRGIHGEDEVEGDDDEGDGDAGEAVTVGQGHGLEFESISHGPAISFSQFCLFHNCGEIDHWFRSPFSVSLRFELHIRFRNRRMR